MFVDPDVIDGKEKFKSVSEDVPLCGCCDNRFVPVQMICKTETESKTWNTLVCENVSPEYVVDMYKFYANEDDVRLSFLYKPSQKLYAYDRGKECRMFKTEEKLVVLTVFVRELVELPSFLNPAFRPIVGYKLKTHGECKSLELLVKTPQSFGKFHVIGDHLMFAVSEDRTFSVAPSTIHSLLKLSDYCHRPVVLFKE
jgi:hypothetical protein